MSCQSCCAFDIPQIADFASGGFYIYPTQDYSFVITTCPIGVICPPGLLPQLVTVKKNQVPPVIVPPNPTLLTLQGCQSLVSATVPPGASSSVIAGIAAGLQQQVAQQQATCNLTQTFVLKTFKVEQEIFNTDQTATCPLCGPHPVTVGAGTFQTVIFDPTPADITVAQNYVNGLALAQAKSMLQCDVTNAFAHFFGACPANPGLVADVDIYPGAVCLPFGSAQAAADSQASFMGLNQVAAILQGFGCVCLVTGTYATGTGSLLSLTCGETYDIRNASNNLIAPPNTIFLAAGTNQNFWQIYFNATGVGLSGFIKLTPLTYTGPPIIFNFP